MVGVAGFVVSAGCHYACRTSIRADAFALIERQRLECAQEGWMALLSLCLIAGSEPKPVTRTYS